MRYVKQIEIFINFLLILIVYFYCFQAKIVKLIGEVDYAVKRHAKMQEEEEQRRQQIFDSKLKPKGDLLLPKQTDKIEK